VKQDQKIYSLTTEFRERASAGDKADRVAKVRAKQTRNQANQLAIGNWHNESRGKMVEVPFPERKTH